MKYIPRGYRSIGRVRKRWTEFETGTGFSLILDGRRRRRNIFKIWPRVIDDVKELVPVSSHVIVTLYSHTKNAWSEF